MGIRVVFLVQRFPGFGGAEGYVFQLCLGLSRKGVDCTILSSNLDNRNAIGLPSSVKIERFPLLFAIGEYHLWRGLLRKLLETEADIIHTNSYGYFHSDLVSLVHDLRKFKLVFTSHGFHGLEIFKSTYRNPNQKISSTPQFIRMLRPFHDLTMGIKEVRSADALIALSPNDFNVFKLMGASPSKIYDIPLGISDSFFEGGDEEFKANLRERFDGHPTILSVGELSWAKGKDIPLRSLVNLVKDYPRAKLVYVGKDGGMYQYLKELTCQLGLEKNIVFEGYVPSEELVNYYRVANVLVHTSYAEGLSTVLLEAMAAGLPMISTPAGGNGYLLQKSRGGIIVPFNDPKRVCIAINRILSDASFSKSLASNGSTFAFNNHRWSELINKYESLYQRLVSE